MASDARRARRMADELLKRAAELESDPDALTIVAMRLLRIQYENGYVDGNMRQRVGRALTGDSYY